MKTKILNQTEERNPKFPLVMQSKASKTVVLFTNPTTGTVLYLETSSTRALGEVSSTWTDCRDTDVWKSFEGTIHFSNEFYG